MTFKLRIPGRDNIVTPTAANSANPLIEIGVALDRVEQAANESPSPEVAFQPISRLAGLAAIHVT